MLISLLRDTADILLPAYCLLCKRPLRGRCLCSCCTPAPYDAQAPRCQTCHEFVQLSEPDARCDVCRHFPLPMRSIRVLWSYTDNNVRELISVMKYRPSRRVAGYLAGCVAEALPALYRAPDWNVIIPMPASAEGLAQRGFNQCEILSRAATRLTPVPVSGVLRRSRRSLPQASLSTEQRIRNARASLYVRGNVAELSILLVDDVITSGASSLEAVRCLLEAGARCVDLLALARAPRWQEHRLMAAEGRGLATA